MPPETKRARLCPPTAARTWGPASFLQHLGWLHSLLLPEPHPFVSCSCLLSLARDQPGLGSSLVPHLVKKGPGLGVALTPGSLACQRDWAERWRPLRLPRPEQEQSKWWGRELPFSPGPLECLQRYWVCSCPTHHLPSLTHARIQRETPPFPLQGCSPVQHLTSAWRHLQEAKVPLEPDSQQKPETKLRGLGPAAEAAHRAFHCPLAAG